jgi:hypothetical protein
MTRPIVCFPMLPKSILPFSISQRSLLHAHSAHPGYYFAAIPFPFPFPQSRSALESQHKHISRQLATFLCKECSKCLLIDQLLLLRVRVRANQLPEFSTKPIRIFVRCRSVRICDPEQFDDMLDVESYADSRQVSMKLVQAMLLERLQHIRCCELIELGMNDGSICGTLVRLHSQQPVSKISVALTTSGVEQVIGESIPVRPQFPFLLDGTVCTWLCTRGRRS